MSRAFGRDLQVSYRVWCRNPATRAPPLRDFPPTTTLTGLKPARVTGRNVPSEQAPYDRALIRAVDIADFADVVRNRLLSESSRPAHVIAAFDAPSLFGHWW